MAILRAPFTERSLHARWLPFVIVAIAVSILLSYRAAGALGVSSGGADEPYSLRDDVWHQSWGVLDAPTAIAWLPSSLAARASMAVALGRRSALRELGGATTALGCALFAFLLWRGGHQLFPVVLATLAMAFAPTFWSHGLTWSVGAFSPVWALGAALVGRRWLATGDGRYGIAAFVFALLSVLEEPSFIGVLPAAALYVNANRTSSTRSTVFVVMAGLAAAGLVATVPRIDAVRMAPWTDALGVAIPSRGSMWWTLHRHGWISPLSLLPAELTALGALLLVIGFGSHWGRARDRSVLVTLVVGAMLGRMLTPQVHPELAGPVVALVAWALVTTGLEWLGAAVPAGRPFLVGAVGVLVLGQPALTRLRLMTLDRTGEGSIEQRVAIDMRMSGLPDGQTLMVSTGRRVDAAVQLSSTPESSVVLIPQSADTIAPAIAGSRPVLALPRAQSHLESVGYRFERAFAGGFGLGRVVGRQVCAPLTAGRMADVSLQIDSGSFSLRSETETGQAGRVTVYLAAPRPLIVRDHDRVATPFDASLLLQDAGPEGADARRQLSAATARGGGIDGWPITVVTVSSSGGPVQAAFSLSETPQAAVAISTVSSSVSVCAAASRADFTLLTAPRAQTSARMVSGSTFGLGWHNPEGPPDDTFRWTAVPEASIRAEVHAPGAIRVTVTAMPAAPASAHPHLGLVVNACDLPDQPLQPGLNDITWSVGAECWVTGANQMWLRSGPLVTPASLGVSGDTRPLGARISTVRLGR